MRLAFGCTLVRVGIKNSQTYFLATVQYRYSLTVRNMPLRTK